ncbi:hypothetical protein MYCTH_2301747 [Thermothelomyces thermophilus ATCC 42464]|uniref:UBC core domain-containing protein n=1 Tax=Thermothelomyces thermophilus (strain ATCC 42464 / BCRC 31852 / DSM 1799) TaxID=573729 RepID=G2QA20_THET4|nr:uncharacterized protein MYCTH_2301747 [Thermothelomyces thermophilus ATCC 42464]AEO56624.1 hypothetical protein MYCTH_2301747 [Thermothelomyces thermophilus ATCC 42464]
MGNQHQSDLMSSPSSVDYDLDELFSLPTGNSSNVHIPPMISPMEPSLFPSEATNSTRKRWTQDGSDRKVAGLLQEKLTRQDGPSPASKQSAQDRRVDVDLLAEYRKRLRTRSCAACKTPIETDAADLIRRTGKMLKESRYLHPFSFCSRCKGWFCAECLRYYPGSATPTLKHVVSSKHFQTAWCCDQGRVFLIFSLLCGLEATTPSSPSSKRAVKICYAKAESSSSLGPFAAKSRSRNSQSQLSKGTGYGDSFPKREKKVGPGLQDADRSTRELQLYFEALSSVLPSGKRETTAFDRLPQPAVSEMLWRSPILEHASELLRYASIEEMTKQYDPIAAVLDFMETVLSHNSTRPFLVRERILFHPGERLPHFILGRTSKGRATRVSTAYETAQSLSTITQHLAVPCRKFIEVSRRIANIDGEEEGGRLLEMVQRICTISDRLSVLRSRLAIEEVDPARGPVSSSLTLPTTNVATRRMRADADKVARDVAHQEGLTRAAEFHRENCVKEVSDDLIVSSSCYEKEAREAEKSEPAPGRMRKLLAQVSSLSADLPQGIYVRHGESRLDVLKVLIVGPADTPYEHGLFEFDMFCGSDFPQRPPKMFFRTTGGGRVRFNPNLYNTGKICFSLLGTWDGQPWEPDCSSILQLLVSIQAMIFNDQPYYNEPGFEYHNDPARVQAYNRNIEHLTVRYALNSWLAERLAGPTQPSVATHPSTPKETAPLQQSQETTEQPLTPKHPPQVTAHDSQPGPREATDHLTGALHQQSMPANSHPSAQLPVQGKTGNSTTYAPPSTSMATPTSTTGSHSQLDGWTANQPKSSQIPAVLSHLQSTLTNHIDSLMPIELLSSPMISPFIPEELSFYTTPEPIPPPSCPSPPEEDDPIFGDIVREHFRLRAGMIMETVRNWEKQTGKGPGIGEAVATLESQLKRHGFIN